MRPACFSKAASLFVFTVFTSAILILPTHAQTPAAPAAAEAEAVKKPPVKPPAKPAKPAAANASAKPAAANANAKAPANANGAAGTTSAATTNAVAAPNGRSPIPTRGNTNVVNANNGASAANPATANNLLNNTTNNTTNNGRSAIPTTNSASGTPAANNAASNSTARPGISTQGLHVFKWGDYQATAYGCARSGTRVLCDFDLTKDHAVQANQNVWNGLILLDQGGKIIRRHDAFFLFADGSQANSAYLSSETPVRMIMEFDGVNANSTSVSLSVGQDRVDSVPVTAEQNNAPAQKQ
jgi:hypothetical protein